MAALRKRGLNDIDLNDLEKKKQHERCLRLECLWFANILMRIILDITNATARMKV